MSSLGKLCFVDQLVVSELGSTTTPVQTIHRASTDRYQNDLNWVDTDTEHTRLRLKEDGHLQICEDIEFFAGPSITNSTKRYSIGLSPDGTLFQIKNEQELPKNTPPLRHASIEVARRSQRKYVLPLFG